MHRTLLFFFIIAVHHWGCASTRPQTEHHKGNLTEESSDMSTLTLDATQIWTDADALTADCTHVLKAAAGLRTTIMQTEASNRNEDSVLQRFNDLMIHIDDVEGLASLFFNVHPDQKVRDAAQVCRQEIEKFLSDMRLDRELYQAVNNVDKAGLDPLASRFHEHVTRDFKRAGVNLEAKTRARIAEIHEEIVKLGQEYSQNVRNDVRTVYLDGPKALKGLPQDYIDGKKPDENGKITITTDYPDFLPVLRYAEDESIRKELYGLFNNRGYPNNEAILKRLLELRYELANILGHPHWASYNAEDKMVKTAERIESFISEITTAARPRMDKDLSVLLKAKRKKKRRAKRIEVWDRFFYVGKVREADYGFDARTVRPYFSYEKVRDGMLELYGKLFGLAFAPDADAPVWHHSVTAYRLYQGETLLGRFYLDMHPRKGKYKHAAMFPIRTGMDGLRESKAALVCNFPNPADGDGKALMEHTQVVTFFHEFGHLIHHLMARRGKWVTLAGINVEWDFVEAPSQILEEWAWLPEVLQDFAHHVETGDPIPAKLVKAMRDAEDFGKGVHVMRQVFYTAYSYFLHIRDPATLNLDGFTTEMYDDYSPYPRMDGGHVFAHFGHLVGYSSMYYTYQWSLAIAKDLFTRFAANGVMDPGTAERYRQHILAPGGTVDADEMVEGFLGRPFAVDAYRNWLAD